MAPTEPPHFELRSASVDALLFIVKTVDIEALQSELVRRFDATPDFFADDAIAIDVRRLEDGQTLSLRALANILQSFRMNPIGVVARPAQAGLLRDSGLMLLDSPERRPARSADDVADIEAAARKTLDKVAREAALRQTAAAAPIAAPAVPEPAEPIHAASPAAAAAEAAPTMMIDRPVRSGQRIYARGDLIVLGLVSNGAELIAEGNIHIYAPLRGRALAGALGRTDARIFCTCMEPELVSIAGVYRTAEHDFPAEVLAKPGIVRLDDGKLIVESLKLK